MYIIKFKYSVLIYLHTITNSTKTKTQMLRCVRISAKWFSNKNERLIGAHTRQMKSTVLLRCNFQLYHNCIAHNRLNRITDLATVKFTNPRLSVDATA